MLKVVLAYVLYLTALFAALFYGYKLLTPKVNTRKRWDAYPPETIIYGRHRYGYGNYRIDPATRKTIELWIDLEMSTDDEIAAYKKYLKENGWDHEAAALP